MNVRKALAVFAAWGMILTSYGFDEVSMQGRPTARTPFDQKLSMAGMLQPLPSFLSSPAHTSVESLFQEASRFRYARDVSNDRWQTAEETEARRSGDCEDKAIWLYTKLKEEGYSGIRLVIGKYRPHERNYHVWVNYTDASGREYILDPAIQKRAWERSAISYGFYEPYFSYDGPEKFRHKGFIPVSR